MGVSNRQIWFLFYVAVGCSRSASFLSRFGFGVMSGDILFLLRPDRRRNCSPLAWWFVLGFSQFRSAGMCSTLTAVWLVVMVLLIPASCCCWFCVLLSWFFPFF
ncbi:hypothetical protein QL285_064359 [Trifolium repens]|nr:hypothetical protein QL285_064359 [Trifolium repens]